MLWICTPAGSKGEELPGPPAAPTPVSDCASASCGGIARQELSSSCLQSFLCLCSLLQVACTLLLTCLESGLMQPFQLSSHMTPQMTPWPLHLWVLVLQASGVLSIQFAFNKPTHL